MNSNDLLSALEARGTAQNRQVFARHGVRPPLFGVSPAQLSALAKPIGIDDLLACELWASGIHDARMLATRIADPARTRRPRVEAWIKDLDNHLLSAALARLVSHSPDAAAIRGNFAPSPDEFASTLAWDLVAAAAGSGAGIDDAELERHLAAIAARIHERPNRTRHAMNGALIAIGLRSADWRRRALAVAKAIGEVVIDHGETNCTTPCAVEALRRAARHRSSRSPA